jgi:hypothetical protein
MQHILPVTGADYVGPLPAELQSYVDFAVGVLAVSKLRDAGSSSCRRPKPRPHPQERHGSRRTGRRIDEDLSGNGEKTRIAPTRWG